MWNKSKGFQFATSNNTSSSSIVATILEDDDNVLIQDDDDDAVDNDNDHRDRDGCNGSAAGNDDDDDDDSLCGKEKSWKVCDIDCRISVQTCAGVLEYLAMGVPTSSIPHYDNVVDEEYRVETDVDRQERLLTTALAILLDSTSQGPDPLSLSALGWAYGLGAGGGMGDFGACHYVPGDIGGELRELENTVSSKVQIDYGVPVSNYTMDFPATRFCTVGGLPPHKQPYAPGALWQPPIAGICVPSSCSSRDLLTLFGDDAFRDNLLWHSSTIEKSFDSTTTLDVGNITNVTTTSVHIPPAASRRYKYVSSLALSISTGIKFKMGIQCAGETGLAELDDAYMGTAFRGYDYWCTIGLILFLACCVLIGTLTSGWASSENEEQVHKRGQSIDNAGGDTNGLMIEPNLGNSTHFGEGYGSIEGGNRLEETNKEDDMRRENARDCFSGVRGSLWNCISLTLNLLARVFAPFDATQSFYEITRMSRDSRYNDVAHQQTIKTTGSAALDRAYSSLGLFPTYPSTGEDGENAEGDGPWSESVSSSQCLNGMRSISMLWIILGHTIVVQSSIGYQNPMAVLPPTGMIASTPAMFFFSARYAVDTFFFIGGYLVMSGMLKKLDPSIVYGKVRDSKGNDIERWMHKLKLASPFHRVLGTYAHRLKNNKKPSNNSPLGVTKWFVPFVLHRVLRILPTYGFVLLVWWKLAVTWGEGPFWPRWATFVAQCDKYAWTNMLFINNLVPRHQKFGESSECMYHAWYLGVDFQLCAVLTPIFVSLYLRRGCRRLALLLEFLLVALVISMTFINTYLRDWSGHLMDGKQTLQYDRDAYINPFYRATPYLAGFITAQMWHEKSRLCPNLGLRRRASNILSVLAAALMATLTFTGSSAYDNLPCQIWQNMHTSGCGSGWSMHKLAFFNSFMRPLWSFGLSVMCLLGFNGQLHPFCGAAILNWAGWDPIAKLSFGMYLLHPMIINVWFLSRSSKFSYSHVDFVFLCAGIVTLTFLSALLVGILVEWPMSKITKNFETWLWRGKLAKKSTNGDTENNTNCEIGASDVRIGGGREREQEMVVERQHLLN